MDIRAVEARLVACLLFNGDELRLKIMNLEQNVTVACPYCGEEVGIVVDCTIKSQRFVEDCQVCCRPIQFAIEVSEDGEILELRANSEDE